MLLRRMKNHCPRCDSGMESKGFRVLSGGIKKRRYRCLSCRYQYYEGQAPTNLDHVRDFSVVVKKRFTPCCKDVSCYEDTKSDYFQILSSFSNARFVSFDFFVEPERITKISKKELYNRHCDCDSDSFLVLGCLIHAPEKFYHHSSFLDGSFCELHDGYFGH